MTNEQAKSELMQIYGMLSEEKKQALDVLMAQADGEYISRQAVMDCYKKWQPYMATRLHEFEKELSELPSVAIPSAEPTGHWKRISMDKYSEHAKYWYRCDKCGKHNLGNTDWCPNCGCRMVEPQESEEQHG